jgi:cell division protein FtsW
MKLSATVLFICVCGLLALGLVILYSLGMMKVGASYLVKQTIWCSLGMVICLVVMAIDYRHLKKISLLMFLAALAALVWVLVDGKGMESNGARRWLRYGVVGFQPSEFAKIALIIVLAHYGEHFQRHMGSFRKGVLPACGIIGSVLVLIFLEPDRGTTLFLGALSLIMLVLAGVRWLVVLLPASLGAAGLGFLLWRDPLIIYRVTKGWWNMEDHKSGAAYQSWQGLIAFGSGGPTGLGLGDGRQKMGFIPELQTDFILPVVGEELGLVATAAVVLTFLVLVICGFRIARRAPDIFGFLLASGLTWLIGLQAWINIAVVTSVLPNKGLSLPFVSYGGSNLVMMLFAVGLLLSIARHSAEDHSLAVGLGELQDEVPA